MKITLFGADVSRKDICMEKDGKKYVVTFYIDIFGNIKDVKFLIDGKYIEDGNLYTTPNIFGIIREVVRLIKLRYFRKSRP